MRYKIAFWALFWSFSMLLAFASGIAVGTLISPSRMHIENWNSEERIPALADSNELMMPGVANPDELKNRGRKR